MNQPTRRRRIDRVTAPDFLDGVEERSPAELRDMRDDCRQEESRLSYTRRVLQGQLDIAKGELLRRGGDDEAGSLLSDLPSILADEPTDRGRGAERSAPLYVPPDMERRSEELTGSLAHLPDLSEDELVELIDQLRTSEAEVSAARRVVLDHLDRLQEELVRRYRDGSIGIDEVVGPTLSGARDEL